MKIFAIKTLSSNCIACIVATGQTARNGINLLLTIALSVVCIALLAACGGGGGGGSGGGGTPPPGVSDLKIIPAESSLQLSWTNPNRTDISDFRISWVSTTPPALDSELTGDDADKAALAMVDYVLDDLTDESNYTVSLSILYEDGGVSKVVSGPLRRTGNNTDGDTLPDSLDPDDDNDGVNDDVDNCQLIKNADQTNTDKMLPGGGDALGDACDPDVDDDTHLNTVDVDDNNNGLIEIHTLDDLARLRDDLNGNGTDDGNIDAIDAVGAVGCPGSGCNGYELTRSLNFSDPDSYAKGSDKMAAWTNRSGHGWQPIGSCDFFSALCSADAYAAILDGQGWSIANLFISAPGGSVGVGLFAALNGRIQNLHLSDARVGGGSHYIGILVGSVGFNGNNRIRNVSITGGSVMSPPGNRVGALVGEGLNANIRYVHVSGVSISGELSVGGLVGYGERADIRYAYMSGVDISGNEPVGGLVGHGQSANIRHAYVSGGRVSGNLQVGGLVGNGSPTNIGFAYASGGRVSGNSDVGGLLGSANDFTIVEDSYWNNETTMRPTSATNSTGDVLGMGLLPTDLQTPEDPDFTGIYAAWGNFWCDPNTGDERESETKPEDDRFIRVWDLGNSTQYPALNCMPGGLAAQGRDKQ